MKNRTITSKFKPPVICAHRGASGHTPENTMAAFRLAIDMHADMLEFDIQQTSDKKLFIMHDAKVKRTTNGKGKITALSSQEIVKLDAGGWFDKKFTGEPVPQFTEVLMLAKDRTLLNIEVKNDSKHEGMLQQVIEEIFNTGFEKDCVLTSFDFAMINEIKKIAPQLQVGYIFSRQGLRARSFKAPVEILSVHFTLATRKFLRKSHKAGKKVYVWTVNNKWMMRRLCKLGVDGIITNFPDRLAEVIEDYKIQSNAS